MRVTASQFLQEYDELARHALSEPVTITADGHDRLVVVSAEEYSRLRARDQRAFRSEELTEADLSLIERSEMPPGHEHLDAELAGWKE